MMAKVRRRATSRSSSSTVSGTAVMRRAEHRTACAQSLRPLLCSLWLCGENTCAFTTEPQRTQKGTELLAPFEQAHFACVSLLLGRQLAGGGVVALGGFAVAEGFADGGEVEVEGGVAGLAAQGLPPP